MEFSRQAYWSGLPCPPPGDLPNPGIEPRCPALPVDSLSSEPFTPAGKESACNVGDLGLIPGLGRSPGEENGYVLQYYGLENSMDCIVHRVAESDVTEKRSFHFKNLLPNPSHKAFPLY